MHDQYRQIEQMLGLSHHSYTEGYHCETLLRHFLRQVLPHQYSVDTGFIRFNPARHEKSFVVASPQLDIIVHDSTLYSPIYRLDDLVVVIPEAVRAVIEVKKTADDKALDEGLSNIAMVKSYALNHNFRILDPRQVFTCLFAFTSKLAVTSKTYATVHQRVFRRFKYHSLFPDLLVVSDQSMRKYRTHSNNHDVFMDAYNTILPLDGDKNTCQFSLQYMLYHLLQVAQMMELRPPLVTRFSFPKIHPPVDTVTIRVPPRIKAKRIALHAKKTIAPIPTTPSAHTQKQDGTSVASAP
jgi:hypothetical protein